MFLESEFPDDYYAECLDIHVLLYILHYHFYLSVKLFFNCHPLPISSKCYWSDITAIVSPQLEIRPHGFSSSSCPGGFFSLLSNSYFCVILTSPNIACSMLPRLSLISSSRFFLIIILIFEFEFKKPFPQIKDEISVHFLYYSKPQMNSPVW